MKKSWLFGLFSGDKDDYNDVWKIKITIKANEIDTDVCIFQKNITYKNRVCLYMIWLFLLVYWFVNLDITDKHGIRNL